MQSVHYLRETSVVTGFSLPDRNLARNNNLPDLLEYVYSVHLVYHYSRLTSKSAAVKASQGPRNTMASLGTGSAAAGSLDEGTVLRLALKLSPLVELLSVSGKAGRQIGPLDIA